MYNDSWLEYDFLVDGATVVGAQMESSVRIQSERPGHRIVSDTSTTRPIEIDAS